MNWDRWVGLPWEDKARGPRSYDCWGLFRAAFMAGKGIALPAYDEAYSTAEDQAEVGAIVSGGLGDWVDVRRGTERAFDGAVMRLGGTLHVGLIVQPGRLLHVRRGATSAIEPLMRFSTNDLKLYRHRGLV